MSTVPILPNNPIGNIVPPLQSIEVAQNNGYTANTILNQFNPKLLFQDINGVSWWMYVDTSGRPWIATMDELGVTP